MLVTACSEYTSRTTIPFSVFAYSDYALNTTQNEVSLFRCSKVTSLKMIHLHYAYYLFRFLLPQKTSSFRGFLTDSTYFTFRERSFVVLRASHPAVASDACRSRKPMAVHRVKFALINSL